VASWAEWRPAQVYAPEGDSCLCWLLMVKDLVVDWAKASATVVPDHHDFLGVWATSSPSAGGCNSRKLGESRHTSPDVTCT
jgi:hypothetical protein